MTIFTNSRYNGQTVLRVATPSGNTYPAVYYTTPPQAIRFLQYTCKMGDRMDLLANTYYGDPTLWWVIANANPQLPYPIPLTVGARIRIPQTS